MFKLTIEDDEGKTTVVPLARDEISIGREEGNTIRLTERNVSRRHARLYRRDGTFYIEDLHSYTGVRVNGAAVHEPAALQEGDEVQIADYRIVLRGDHLAPSFGDRPTIPTMPALGLLAGGSGNSIPLATVGGSVAIPGRASVAAMMAVQQPQATADDGVPSSSPSPMVTMPISASLPGTSTARTSPALSVVPDAVGPGADEGGDPATADAFEAQPTVPIRLADEAATGEADSTSWPAAVARLVVVSTDLAGLEIPLGRPSLVIGRTEENEIVLNHRSISRHHAKITREGDHYTIVDLQSANGVRVNGEDYERIELNAGDVVELGHVKLRFVGPRETFVFDPQHAERARVAGGMKYFAAGVALVGIAVGATLVVRGRAHGPTLAGTGPSASPPGAGAASPAQPAATPAATAPPAPSVLLATAQRAVAAAEWDKARATLDQLGAAPADPQLGDQAAELRRKIESERNNAALFAQFDGAANGKRYADALAKYEEIPSDSVYKARGRTRYEEARALLVGEHLAAAEQARVAGRCTAVREEADEVLRLEPQNLLAKEVTRLCRPRPEVAPAGRARAVEASAAVAGHPARSKPASVAALADATVGAGASAEGSAPARAQRIEAPRTGRDPRRVEASRADPNERVSAAEQQEAGDPDALMKQAREAWLRQQCGAAIDYSRKALRAKPGLTDAYQIIAVCSCTLKDAEAAGRAYAKLDDKNRSLVRALCQKNGVSLAAD